MGVGGGKIKEKILRSLRGSSSFVSGSVLASKLGVTRTALNKHISQLKRLGYQIDAVPHRGYRLRKAPDVLFDFEIKSLLMTKQFGRMTYYFSEIGSTQDFCRELAEKGEAEGALVISEVQTKGRGRLGREWKSPAGGLWFSLLLRPEGIGFENLGLLPLIAALAMAKALEKEAEIGANLKWPNDLVIGRSKVGGVLTELQSEIEKVHSVQLGVGLNVNNKPPAKTIYPATSLREVAGRKLRRADILGSFLLVFEKFYLSFKKSKTAHLLKAIEEKIAFKGERVILRTSQGIARVKVIGIDRFGRLVVEKNGKVLSFASGEIEKK